MDEELRMDAQMMDKKELRRAMIAKRKQLSLTETEGKSKIICARVREFSPFREAKAIGLYYPIHNEVNLLPLRDTFPGRTLFPKVHNDVFHFYAVANIADFRMGAYHIPEPPETQPQKPDVLFIPGVAFDRDGYRLGYGKGYYDRYLSAVNALRIGIGYDLQIVDSLPHQEHDKPVDYIITETQVIACRIRK